MLLIYLNHFLPRPNLGCSPVCCSRRLWSSLHVFGHYHNIVHAEMFNPNHTKHNTHTQAVAQHSHRSQPHVAYCSSRGVKQWALEVNTGGGLISFLAAGRNLHVERNWQAFVYSISSALSTRERRYLNVALTYIKQWICFKDLSWFALCFLELFRYIFNTPSLCKMLMSTTTSLILTHIFSCFTNPFTTQFNLILFNKVR